MTIGAVLCDVESRFAIMAGTAGFTLTHLRHADLIAVGLGLEDVGMTFVTAEHVEMCGMRERDHANFLGLNADLIRSIAMTVTAVFGDAERRVAIVAGATGFSLPHLRHADLVAVGLGFEGVGMAFVTAEHVEMRGMRERNHTNITLNVNLGRGTAVTGGTVSGDAESRVAIMTSATGRPLPHLRHADLVAVSFGLEYVRVAFVAAERLSMGVMGEKDFADKALDCYILGTRMAVAAVACDAERRVTIVAGST